MVSDAFYLWEELPEIPAGFAVPEDLLGEGLGEFSRQPMKSVVELAFDDDMQVFFLLCPPVTQREAGLSDF